MALLNLIILFLSDLIVGLEGKEYHALVITKEALCTIPPYNGPLFRCSPVQIEQENQTLDCNQEECRCQYQAAVFTQNCLYNKTDKFVRMCTDFERNCTLYNQVDGGVAVCEERYGSCDITSTPLKNRFAVGYPKFNPATCYPGFRAAKDKCNSTSSSCQGLVEYSISNTGITSLVSCENTCRTETTACTNYTKTCGDSSTHWEDRFDYADVTEECEVEVSKCIEERELDYTGTSANRKKRNSQHWPKKNKPVLVKTYQCGVITNKSESIEFCANSILNNMIYKAECQLYGIELTRHFFEEVYAATTSLHKVSNFINERWAILKELCKLDCFRTLTRELRFCISDLPIQNILPGITQAQLQYLMYRSEDFLCASVPEKKVKETCVEYLDSGSDLNKEIISNLSGACSAELSQWNQSASKPCSQKCVDYLMNNVASRKSKPGCCLADLVKFRKESQPWMELLSRGVFKENALLGLVDKCGIKDDLFTCFERETVHPAVIFVIAVIGVFSVVLTSGTVTFIVIFYRQMEYEGYQKGGFINKIINADFK